MSEVSGKQAASPLAALLLAFATISCCVPLGFLGALGLAGLAARGTTVPCLVHRRSGGAAFIWFLPTLRPQRPVRAAHESQRGLTLGDARDRSRNLPLSSGDRFACGIAGMTMKAKRILIALAVITSMGLFWRFFVSSKTPVGQNPLVVLNAPELNGTKALFNANKGKTRVIALLSPT